jgi:hypothetical protein
MLFCEQFETLIPFSGKERVELMQQLRTVKEKQIWTKLDNHVVRIPFRGIGQGAAGITVLARVWFHRSTWNPLVLFLSQAFSYSARISVAPILLLPV